MKVSLLSLWESPIKLVRGSETGTFSVSDNGLSNESARTVMLERGPNRTVAINSGITECQLGLL